MNAKIDEVWPERPPACAGCGKEVNPEFAHWTTDYRIICSICAKLPRWKALLRKPLDQKGRAAERA